MSLARAFTTRRNRADKPSTGFLGRSSSHRSPAKSARPQISGPINLISSTNVLSFDAPDIVGTVPTPYATAAYVERSMSFEASDSSSRSSADHSDVSSASARDYSTDASSLTSSPNSPEPNHLSCYFKPSVYTDLPDRPDSQRSSHSSQPSFDAPAVPQRAPSHSKKAHMHVSRQRSISRLRTPPSTAQEMIRESSENFPSDEVHPFGKELEQLNEIAEEFGGVVRDAEADADYDIMESYGLAYFSATDYMMEVQEMLDTVFEEEDVQAGWF